MVADAYPGFAPELLGPLVSMLSRSREAFGGDIDKFLIMMVVGIRTAEHQGLAVYTQDELISGDVPVLPTHGANTRSVAEAIGAPRETVRRKVADLIEAGWIVRAKNELRFTALAYQQLADVRAGIENLAVCNFEVVAKLFR